ncbi:tRNA selenocysteine 1-associated protein 1 [Sarcoptes scabiei]|uniref:tRNA selenocysteine 1-associated protein 1 n=1 Tax=Sarcoptes scabiei TaxID=52283 RepID=A0A834VBJ8_SARSC|nr:tRNA selenocysteine 1-associated protein 1 [Sarcoptes scabiei]
MFGPYGPSEITSKQIMDVYANVYATSSLQPNPFVSRAAADAAAAASYLNGLNPHQLAPQHRLMNQINPLNPLAYPTHPQAPQAHHLQPRSNYLHQQSPSQDPFSSKTLWMGNIDSTMDENFIKDAFNALGINVHNIKVIRNKDNGMPLGYAFVSFDDRSMAEHVLQQVNGKQIPNITNEDKRFCLKRATRNGRFSVFVGNLPPQIDNDVLMSTFIPYFPSVSSAKVIMNDGISKGFGFVSFEDENDYYKALNQQVIMFGTTPISVNRARNQNQSQRQPRQYQFRNVRQNA